MKKMVEFITCWSVIQRKELLNAVVSSLFVKPSTVSAIEMAKHVMKNVDVKNAETKVQGRYLKGFNRDVSVEKVNV